MVFDITCYGDARAVEFPQPARRINACASDSGREEKERCTNMPADQPENSPAPQWTSRQAWTQAAICLVLGVALGFLARGSGASAARRAASAAKPSPPNATGVAQVTPDQLRHMADKKAEPLLAQLRAEPANPELLVKLGYIYYATQNYGEAAAYYKRAAEVKDDPVVRTELGRSYYYAGQPEKALAEFEHVLKLDPDNANALYNVGMIKWQNNFDINGAIAAWQQILRKHPNHPRRSELEQLIARARQHRSLQRP